MTEAHAVLKNEQRAASAPGDHVWLSASAGTGKTYVLSARVLRLLLNGVRPESILCLTFTKAGAAEMAERVQSRLAWWVRLDDGQLFKELEALGAASGPEDRRLARTLFAETLDARGGLRIMTIHAFCQTLLAGFPIEAGLTPGFRPIEGREAATLAQTVLAELVVRAELEGDKRLLSDLSTLSKRMGEDKARSFLIGAARSGTALEELSSGLVAQVRRAMDVPSDYGPGTLIAACHDDSIDDASLRELKAMHTDWGTARGKHAAEVVATWLASTPETRAGSFDHLASVWTTGDGDLRIAKGHAPPTTEYAECAARLALWSGAIQALVRRAALANDIAAALGAARNYARAWTQAKAVRGFVDFDDMISLTAKLLAEPGIGDWIRYKLDQATDHILVDEAQDTNPAQWAIVKNLAEEFFTGDGPKADTLRTLFSVGDYKQSIFGFQGSDPDEFNEAGRWFATQAALSGRDMSLLSLQQSFRSSQPVLDVVDQVLADLGGDALGLPQALERHVSATHDHGDVLLLAPVTGDSANDEEGWIADHVRKLAGQIAKQVRIWLDTPLWLAGEGRALAAKDIMILVRKRGDLASLLVARLQAEGVEVAGVDRLRLQSPLVVKDVLAAMRFAIQPDDDLTLASLLVSPLLGWDQDALFIVAHGRKGSLWSAIAPGPARDTLLSFLNAADRVTPFAFLEGLLSGPLDGRKKLLARLGDEARDPLDELLSAALAFQSEGVATLQMFLDWFDRSTGDVVRDAATAGNAVRVMTVHGAKGLEAPLVILADAAGDPDTSKSEGLAWVVDGVDEPLPLFRPTTAERALVPSLADAADRRAASDRREHWRLLYVAMTRAKERLVVAGSLGPKAKGVVPADSWHSAVGRALLALGGETVSDPLWGTRFSFASKSALPSPTKPEQRKPAPLAPPPVERPGWLDRVAAVEARPPRPLAPSSIGADLIADPPGGSSAAIARRQGQLMHGLFERLPALAPATRRTAGLNWLAGQGAGDSDSLIDSVLAIIDDPDFASLFAPGALTEAPIAGVIDGIVISGTVDRLIITEHGVDIIDFKTGRRVPATPDTVPQHHARQVAAYAAVLAQIFPDRLVSAALLYTAGPVLHRLSADQLARHKPGLASHEDKFASAA